jgi:hypothetical protein
MFAEARQQDAVLLLDEADSFLADRRDAQQSWEVTQVNELLTQMEAFEGIFVCTTNLMKRLDQASLRRFAFKIKFDYLNSEQRWAMFLRELARMGCDVSHAPEWERRVRSLDTLTPGDFAVYRQVAMLGETLTPGRFKRAQRCAAKGQTSKPMDLLYVIIKVPSKVNVGPFIAVICNQIRGRTAVKRVTPASCRIFELSRLLSLCSWRLGPHLKQRSEVGSRPGWAEYVFLSHLVTPSPSKGAGIGLIIVSILGAILGGTLVAICMVLSLIGGILAVVGAKNVKPTSASLTVDDMAAPASIGQKKKNVLVWGLAGVGVVVIGLAMIAGQGAGKPSQRNAQHHRFARSC